MARAHSIWTLQDTRENNRVCGAFTVKHELIAWLDRNPEIASYLTVYRHQDGAPGGHMYLGNAACFGITYG